MNCEVSRNSFHSNRLKKIRFEDWYNSVTDDFDLQSHVIDGDLGEGCVKVMKWERWFRDFCERDGEGMVWYELDHNSDGLIVIHRV